VSLWIDGPAETDEQLVQAWRQRFPFIVADVFPTVAADFVSDYSVASLPAFEELVLGQLLSQDSVKNPAALPFVKAAVGYLGETLRRAGGGRWMWSQGKFVGMPCVAFDAELGLPTLPPFHLVARAVQIRDGRQFAQVGSRINAAKAEHRTADTPDLLSNLVVAEAQSRGYTCTVAADEIELSGNGASGWVVNLETLRRKAADEPFSQWPDLVADHLSNLWANIELAAESPLSMDDFERMRPLIRTRMYPEEAMPDAGTTIVSRTLAPGLVQRVVIDQVNTIIPVTHDRLPHWPITAPALFQLAEANTRGDGLLEVADLATDSGEKILRLSGSPDYASAHVRWLGEYPVAGQWGSVFVVPCEGLVYLHPVNGSDAYNAVARMANMAVTAHAELPSPVSSSVYWWHDGIIDLAAAVNNPGGRLELYVSPQFQKAMEDIA
jgi:hypothetical protein